MLIIRLKSVQEVMKLNLTPAGSLFSKNSAFHFKAFLFPSPEINMSQSADGLISFIPMPKSGIYLNVKRLMKLLLLV